MRPAQSSSLVVHGLVYDLVQAELLARGAGATLVNAILFVARLLLGLISGLAWYGTARLGLGPKWGLWVGLLWVVHPSFALLANQAGRLNALIAAVSINWFVLLAWRRSRRPRTALFLGLALAATCLVGLEGLLLGIIAVPAMLLSTRGPDGRLAGVLAVVAGLAAGTTMLVGAIVVPRSFRPPTPPPSAAVSASIPAGTSSWPATTGRLTAHYLSSSDLLRVRAGIWLWRLRQQLAHDAQEAIDTLDGALWSSLDDASGSPLAVSARAWATHRPDSRPSAIRFLMQQCRAEPRACALWLAGRSFRAIYSTVDNQTHYPLVLLQFTWLLPALWGLWISLRYRPWRWLAVSGGLFALAHWVLIALAEPLARNLTPVGGFVILFGLVGAVDAYERLFGRRLTAPAPASQPARLRRMQRNISGRPGPET